MTERDLPSDLDGTIVQAGDALAEAREMSARAAETPSGPGAAPSAPRVPGYTLAEVLGRGAFAQAWKAVQARTGKTVALKVFHQSRGVNWLFLRREVERLVRLDKHPHVVSLLDADLAADPPYYATDLMEGGSLERFVDPMKPVEAAKVAGWMDEIAQALSFVHGKGIIHCDLKPANVLLDSEGRVRVADFGQARVLAEGQGALGTLFYMAPEQAKLGDEGEAIQPDVRWDLYALGATAYALLTGKAPYSETLTGRLESSSSVAERLKIYRELSTQTPSLKLVGVKGLDEDLGAIVMKCLQPDPDKRYGSAGAILADLSARRTRRPVSPLAHRTGYRVKRYLQRNAVAAGIAAVAAAGLAGLGVRLYFTHAEVRAALVQNLLVRAQQYSQQGDYASAAAVYIGLDRFAPSRLARRNALAHLARLLVPVRVLRHEWNIKSVRFSPDGSRLATGHHDNTARLWNTATGEPAGPLLRHQKETMASIGIAFSPDGEWLATTSPADGDVRLWSAGDGTPRVPGVFQYGNRHDGIRFSPDGRFVATFGGNEGRIGFLDLTRSATQTVQSRTSGTRAIAFTADSKLVIQAPETGPPLFWDPLTGSARGSAELPGTFGVSIEMEKDGKSLLVAANNGDIVRIPGPGMPAIVLARHPAGATGVALSPDGKTAVSASSDGSLLVWSARDGARKWASGLHCWITSVQWLAQGRVLVTLLDRSAQVIEGAGALAGARLAMAFHLGKDVMAVASADSMWMASCDGSSVATVWRLDPSPLRRSPDEWAWAPATAIDRDAKAAWRLTYDPSLVPWDLATARQAGDPIPLPASCFPLALSPDGALAAAGESGSGRIHLIDLPGRKILDVKMDLESVSVTYMAISPDGSRLFAESPGGSRLWELPSGRPVGPVLKHPGGVLKASFSPDGRRLFVLSGDAVSVFIWSAVDGSPAGAARHLAAGLQDFAVSPDGIRIATAGGDGAIRIWDAVTGAPDGIAARHDQYAYRVAFSPDGRLLLSGGADGTARMTEVPSCRPHGRPMLHPWGICAVAFSPDGATAATGIWTGEVRLWDVEAAESLGPPMDAGGPPNWISFSPDSGRVIMDVQAIPQLQVWDTGWLAAEPSREDIEARIAAASRMRLSRAGNLDPIPPDEFQRLVERLGGGGAR